MSPAAGESKTSVRVTIAGERYTLRTDADEAYARRCAALVDERMREIGGQTALRAKKTAIMAALSLSNDLLQRERRSRNRVQGLVERLREALAETPAGAGPE